MRGKFDKKKLIFYEATRQGLSHIATGQFDYFMRAVGQCTIRIFYGNVEVRRTGQFQKGYLHGFGKLEVVGTRFRYTGLFNRGRMRGPGVMELHDGSKV